MSVMFLRECDEAYIRRIILDNIINLRNIKTSCGHISADKDTSLAVDKLKKGGCAFLLFLFAMN
jgi:pyrroloquinoline quinone (PQQ) biosynthesis protein C